MSRCQCPGVREQWVEYRAGLLDYWTSNQSRLEYEPRQEEEVECSFYVCAWWLVLNLIPCPSLSYRDLF